MKTHWGFFIFASLLCAHAVQAQDLTIVDVRRNITLADDDVVYKDFYINGGESNGLKKNLVVTALRKLQVRDASGSQTYGEILVPVGQVRIIATYGKISVAREYKLLSRDELPMLEQVGLMNGDKIDLQGSFVDNAKPVYKKKPVAVAPAPAAAATKESLVAVVTTTTTTASTGPAPASVAAPKLAETTTAPAANAPKLEKTADSGAAKAQ